MSRRLFTHDGIFHCDEVAAAAVLIEAGVIPSAMAVVRTRRHFETVAAGDLVIDVTPPDGKVGIGDGVVVADHHQKNAALSSTWQRDEGPRLASAGWAWREFGKNVLAAYQCPLARIEQAWQNIDKQLFWGIDAADNGELPPSEVASYTVSQAVSAFNPAAGPMADQDELFGQAVAFFRSVLKRVLWTETYRQREFSRIRAAIEKQGIDPVLVLDKGGSWRDVILECWESADHILVVIYPDPAAPGIWRIQSAPGSKTDPFAMRCGAPLAMRGIRADAGITLGPCKVEFIHPAGFIGGVHAASAEEAYLAAREWIALSE